MPRIEENWVEQYFGVGVDVFNRRLFVGDITEASVDRAVKGLFLMQEESKDDPVELFINSNGGDVYECLALYDTMRLVTCPVHTFGYGKIFSAAPLILSAGEKGHRWISESAFVMFHTWSAVFEGTSYMLKADVKQAQVQDKIWTERFEAHTRKTAKFWTGLANRNHDVYFDADTAVEYGIVDHIWKEVA
jgi:ATP-dependent Clp protease protease subunit